MAVQCSLCLFVLALLAHNTLSNPATNNPTTNNPTVPPLHEVDEKKAVVLYPVGPDGNRIICDNDHVCTESVLGPESQCVGTHCQCKVDNQQSPDSKKCLIVRDTLGSGCEEDWQCSRVLGHDVGCISHLCSCIADAVIVDGKCRKQIALGGPCKDNEECAGGHNTICRAQICQCISSKVPHPDNTQCLDEAQSTGDTCIETIQCSAVLGDGASCQQGKCQCLPGYHGKNNACVKNLILEEKCTDVDGECYLEDSFGIDHVECDDICKCKVNYHPSKDRKLCLSQGQPDPSGAAGISPLFATIVSIMLARIAAS